MLHFFLDEKSRIKELVLDVKLHTKIAKIYYVHEEEDIEDEDIEDEDIEEEDIEDEDIEDEEDSEEEEEILSNLNYFSDILSLNPSINMLDSSMFDKSLLLNYKTDMKVILSNIKKIIVFSPHF